jgi:cbb3-type cytochrome oxidase subunit 3
MLTAGMNALAMMRFGGFRIAHGGGDALGLLVMGVAVLGILVWALSRSEHNQSTKN